MSGEMDLTTEEWQEIVRTAVLSHHNAVAVNLRPVIQRILAARVASAAADAMELGWRVAHAELCPPGDVCSAHQPLRAALSVPTEAEGAS